MVGDCGWGVFGDVDCEVGGGRGGCVVVCDGGVGEEMDLRGYG